MLRPESCTRSHLTLASKLVTIDSYVIRIIEDVFEQCVRKVEGEKKLMLTDSQYNALGSLVTRSFIAPLKVAAKMEVCKRLLSTKSKDWCDKFMQSLTNQEEGKEAVDPLHSQEAKLFVEKINESKSAIQEILLKKGREYAKDMVDKINTCLPTVVEAGNKGRKAL